MQNQPLVATVSRPRLTVDAESTVDAKSMQNQPLTVDAESMQNQPLVATVSRPRLTVDKRLNPAPAYILPTFFPSLMHPQAKSCQFKT